MFRTNVNIVRSNREGARTEISNFCYGNGRLTSDAPMLRSYPKKDKTEGSVMSGSNFGIIYQVWNAKEQKMEDIFVHITLFDDAAVRMRKFAERTRDKQIEALKKEAGVDTLEKLCEVVPDYDKKVKGVKGLRVMIEGRINLKTIPAKGELPEKTENQIIIDDFDFLDFFKGKTPTETAKVSSEAEPAPPTTADNDYADAEVSDEEDGNGRLELPF